jgi:hypothetical protein
MTDIKHMITETQLTILAMQDEVQRFAKKYPHHELERKRQRIAVHQDILRFLKQIEGKTRP